MVDNQASGGVPSEVVHLVHHVELHRSGWWDRALDRLALVTLWLQQPAEAADIAARLSAQLDQRVDPDRVKTSIARHIAAGYVVQLRDGTLKVSEEIEATLRAESLDVSGSVTRVQARLASIALEDGIEAEPTQLWGDFEADFMVPLLRAAGARIYEIVSSAVSLEESVPTYGDLIRPMCDRYGGDVRATLVRFLDPADRDVRGYVLRQLMTQFAREAAGLDQDVLRTLEKSNGRPDRVRVLVDTNFLFSFLGLHDNPSNNVAADLIALIEQVSAYVKVEYYILPITLDEARRVLRDVISRLNGIAPTGSLAAGARMVSSSGLVTRYLEAAAQYTGGVLTPAAFFGPYEADLATILRERGVGLLNENLDALRMDQQVIDDIHDQEEVQARVRKRGPKPYEANLHDMVLWHFVSRRRPGSATSPLDVGTWICTIDWGLIAFDRHKRSGRHVPPICLTPSSLTQLLQFWVPRSEALDVALVGSLREPLLFLDFDRSTEATTVAILKTMSRFTGVGDLSAGTVRNVLTNEALRAAIDLRPQGSGEVPIEMVETAIIDEARRLEAELDKLREERKADRLAVTREIETKVVEAEGLKQLLEDRHQSVEVLEAELEAMKADLARRSEEASAHSSEVDDLRGRLDAIEHTRLRRRDLLAFVAFSFGLAVATGFLTVVVGTKLASELPAWLLWMLSVTGGVIFWLLGCELRLRQLPRLQASLMARALKAGRKGLVAAFVAVALGVVASAVYAALDDPDAASKPTSSAP